MIGAGPAGSACAQQLARAGFKVLLVDQHQFPRDKVCGDGLIPDAHTAFGRLGVHQAVMRGEEVLVEAEIHLVCVTVNGFKPVSVPDVLSEQWKK